MMGAPGPVPTTSMFVDNFQRCHLHPNAEFFLSYAHSDHMKGLCPGWRLGKLHCSNGTALFLHMKFGKSHLTAMIRTHPVNEPFGVWDPKSRLMLSCTFVDAGHCPGSVIIVFEVDGWAEGRGPVIHTGDFRYHDELRQNPTLQRIANLASSERRCQQIFLDATCAHEDLCRLPAKEASIAQLLDLLNRFSSGRVFLHSHGLGDEGLLVAVANDVRGRGKLLFADKDRYEEVKIAEPSFCRCFCELIEPDACLPDPIHRQVIVVANSRARGSDARLKDMAGIEISCSRMWWAKRARHHACDSWCRPVCDEYGVWHICRSMHSSLNEL